MNWWISFATTYLTERNCILSVMDGSGLASGDAQWRLNNNYCRLVIRGSEALTGCASFMIMFLGIRTVLSVV